MIPYHILIQSAYADPVLSARRLRVSRVTAIPALKAQQVKPVIRLAVSRYDAIKQERIEAFRETGCEVIPIEREGWKLYNEDWEIPAGRKIVGRLDDDDVLATDFCRRVQAGAPVTGRHALIWPTGYVLWRGKLFRLTHVGNQFVSLVSDDDHNPHQEQHWQYPKLWPHVNIGGGYGWIWVRHAAAATSTLPRYRRKPLTGFDAPRFAVDLDGITRSVSEFGPASGNYAEHQSQNVLQHVLKENHLHAPNNNGHHTTAVDALWPGSSVE